MMEGFWRQRPDPVGDRWRDDDLPWPLRTADWSQRSEFLDALLLVESHAESVSYRGWSNCRLCCRENGSRSFTLGEWEWPEGYRHYIVEHHVRPSVAFEQFVNSHAEKL